MKLCTLSQARFERQKTQFSEFQNKILFNSRNLYLFDASTQITFETRNGLFHGRFYAVIVRKRKKLCAKQT
jgi:hypothetical protein